ncbi:MAG: hypothetical protein KAW12_05380 [Candidatus Aminicenantes bacterium]|nr:hypothetical protein [Candidatus Aminicenantes bacterium]
MNKTKFFILLLVLVSLVGCKIKQDDNGNGDEPNLVLVSYEKLTAAAITVTVLDQLLDLDANFNDKIIQNATQYAVNVYKVIYNTTYKGVAKQASGACVIPTASDAVPVVSYQHATILHHSDAPSQYKNLLDMPGEMVMCLLTGACGFVCSAPDYIGYGVDIDTLHPYHHAESTAVACVDMLRAVKELCAELDVNTGSEYFLTGYSEGGYATLALQKKIETDHAAEFPLSAVSAGAGAYDLLTSSSGFVEYAALGNPAYVCFIFVAYNDIYGLGRDLNEIFQAPYSDRLRDGLLNGDYTTNQANSNLTGVTADLFTAKFLADFLGSGETTLKDALRDNNLYQGWIPAAPLRLFHGTADLTVSPANSETAENAFLNNGAADVEYISFPGLNHAGSVLPWVKNTIQWFTGSASILSFGFEEE